MASKKKPSEPLPVNPKSIDEMTEAEVEAEVNECLRLGRENPLPYESHLRLLSEIVSKIQGACCSTESSSSGPKRKATDLGGHPSNVARAILQDAGVHSPDDPIFHTTVTRELLASYFTAHGLGKRAIDYLMETYSDEISNGICLDSFTYNVGDLIMSKAKVDRSDFKAKVGQNS